MKKVFYYLFYPFGWLLMRIAFVLLTPVALASMLYDRRDDKSITGTARPYSPMEIK